MQTSLGRRLSSSRFRLAVASGFGAMIVIADISLVWWGRHSTSVEGWGLAGEGRGVLAVLALAALFSLTDGDLPSVGLNLAPRQGWWWWVKASIWIGLAVAACVAVGLGLWAVAGQTFPTYATSPSNVAWAFLRMCVFAPVLEEVLYRLALCVPLAGGLGPWRAIAVSGVAFAGLHIAGGNPSPENLVGGLFLAWAYLKSESIAVPVLLHSAGNLFALAWQGGTWYWLDAPA